MTTDAAPPAGCEDATPGRAVGLPVPGLAVAAGSAGAAAALVGAAYGGRVAVAALVFVGQLVLSLAWLALLETPGARGGFAIAAAAAAAADVLAALGGGSLDRLAAVLGLALPVALVHQVARHPRPRLTESLVGTLSAAVLAVMTASLVALRAGGHGGTAVVLAGAGAGVALICGRLVDTVVTRPSIVPGARGWPGVIVGIGAAAGVGAALGGALSGAGVLVGLRVAAVTGTVAVAADLALALTAASLPVSAERERSALPPAAAVLPLSVAAPAAYLAGRILFG